MRSLQGWIFGRPAVDVARGTTRRSSRDAVVLLVLIGALTAFIAGAAPAGAAIPANFFSVIDQNGANDVPSQNDLTQFGRDDSDSTVYKLFWSWDSTDDWTGTGQTGDACALFDTNADGNINFAVCGEVNNPGANASVVSQTIGSPFAFSCSDAKNDRCANPSAPLPYTPTQIQAGVLTAGSPGASPPGNLITNTDPFPNLDPDQNWPNDSTLEVVIQKSFLPANAVLTNVCSFPSAGNGGNNNPFDCITTPGGGFLIIKKNAGAGVTAPNFVFGVSPIPANEPSSYTIAGTGQTNPIGVTVGTETVTETVPSSWALTAVSCLLADGSTSTGTFDSVNHRITGATIQSGQVTTCTFTDVNAPSLTVTKDNDANHDAAFTDTETVPGSAVYPYTVTYKATIHNGAASSATITAITDDKVAAPLRSASTTDTDCADVIGTSIAAGATVTCYYDTTFASPAQAQVVNTVSVTATNSAGSDTKTDTSTVNFTQSSGLSLVKTASPQTYSQVGDVIGYSYLVTNTGNVSLAGPVTVSDDKATVTCPAGGLAPGATKTCTASYTITQADLDSGSVTNTATAHANGTNSNPDSETVTAVQSPALSLVKSATTTGFSSPPKAGDKITYHFSITNIGNVTLTSVNLSDALIGYSNHVCGATTLAPGASTSCQADYTLTQADVDAGTVHNSGTACGTPTACDTDTTDTTITRSPALNLVKSANPTIYFMVGNTITYTYTLKNTGNVTLHGPFTITDDKIGTVTCGTSSSTLAPGATFSGACSGTYTIQASDLNASNTGTVTNHATATGKDPANNTVTSNQAQATVNQVARTGQITPTATTCDQFAAGTAPDLNDLFYNVQRNKINSVSPGVLFYYSKITAPSAAFTITVGQSNDKSWKPMGVQNGQALLYNANCTKSSAQGKTTTGNGTTVTIAVSGATPGATYIIGIKYNPGDLVGQSVSTPFPTATYSFITALNANTILQSADTIKVNPK
jgi:uncharacterized repeat protein (TIGR01451 family)